MKEIELINKRGPREKQFLREDGSIVAKIYNQDMNEEVIEDNQEEMSQEIIEE